MPTGYTQMILDGATFQEYALSCARAFGALVLMRDDPADAPIPDSFEPSPYHVKELERSKAGLELAEAMSESDRQAACDKKNADAVASHAESVKQDQEKRAKYEAMLEQARAYKAPSPDHENYRSFMISQIEESIPFDCHDDRPALPPLTPNEWYAKHLEDLRWRVDYHTKELANEIKRAEERTRWVQQLKESLGLPIK